MKNVVKLLIILLIAANSSWANVSSYIFNQANYYYSPIFGANTALASGWTSNSTSSSIPLGFSFDYNNTIYTNVWIKGNGTIYFNSPTGATNYVLATGVNAIAGLNAQLIDYSNNPVTYETIGSVGSHVFIAQWQNCSVSAGDTINFQVRLYESSNKIEVIYGKFHMYGSPVKCQVGLSCNVDMQGRALVNNWNNTAGSNFDSAICTLSPTLIPNDGLLFRWSGQATPYVATQFSLYQNSDCNGPTIDVYSTVFAPNENVTIEYGDGSSLSGSLTQAGTQGHVTLTHNYFNPGSYTIKTKYYVGIVPYDSLHYTYEFRHCTTIPLKLFYDENMNCIKDVGETNPAIPVLIEIDSNGVAIDTISVISSFYYTAIGLYGDIYTFKALPNSVYQIVCPVNGIVSYTISNINYAPDVNVGVSCNNSAFDLAEHLVIPTTGTWDQIGNIYIQNATCLSSNATVTVNFSPKYASQNQWNAQPTPTSHTPTSITWDIANLNAIYTNPNPMHLQYQVWYTPSLGQLVIGDTVNSYAEIDPIAGDINTGNNSTSTTDTVRGGCDPNEMWVAPTGHIYAGTQLKYTINFENTGNDTTYNVYVMDTLSDNVNARSVRLVAASNAMNVSYLTANGHNIVRFDFPNINLLDSSHHGQCDGMVIFNVNTKEGLPDGTTIFNHAGVFFDNNPVVITDTVENIIGQPEKVNNITANTISIYPNPASTTLTINTGNTQYTTYTITNSLGQMITEQPLTTKMAKADISSLAAGIYYITLKGDNGTVVKKFVKM
jgi:uncharacterized repeat protein (TIGR01451 family)